MSRQQRMSAAEYRLIAAGQSDEETLLRWLLQRAELYGWFAHHDRPAMRGDGSYYTPISGVAGFPDVVLAKPGRPHHLWELKSTDGRLRPEQQGWLKALTGREWGKGDSGIVWPVGKGFSVGVIRPEMRDEVEKEID